MVQEMIEYNKAFTEQGAYIPYEAGKYPKKKLAILACMDARLICLLPAALGLRNGDAKIIKNAGGMILDPYDTTIRSLLVAVLELKAEEIMVIAHTDCGVKGMESSAITKHLKQRGITEQAIRSFEAGGTSLNDWFQGFDSPEESVRKSVSILNSHPLMPADVSIHGFVMDVRSGALTAVE